MKRLVLIFSLSVTINAHATLSESTCATMVVNNLTTINGPIPTAQAIQYWTQICKGILDHIKAAAQVGPLPAGTLKDISTLVPINGLTGTATGVIQ